MKGFTLKDFGCKSWIDFTWQLTQLLIVISAVVMFLGVLCGYSG